MSETCGKCGKCLFYTFYFLVVFIGSILLFFLTFCNPFSFPDDSIFKNDKILIDNSYYSNISFYPELEEIYKNYSNDIYYQRKYDLNLSYNISVIPIFMILSLIFGANFICCDNDKAPFIILGIITIISQVIPFFNKIKSNKERSELPGLLNYDTEFNKIFEAYDDYKSRPPKGFFIAVFSLLGVHFIIWLFTSICKKQSAENNTRKKKYARLAVIFFVVFGCLSSFIFAFSPYLYYNCKNRYSDNFYPNEYKYIRNKDSNDYNLIEFYDYKNYPYLEEIYNIYYTNSSFYDKIIKVRMNFDSLGRVYTFLTIFLFPILILVTLILLCCFKCRDKQGDKQREKQCQTGLVVFEILLILSKIYIIFWPYYWIKNKYREDLVNTNEEIKYIIDDYINFSKCRNKFPIIIMIDCVYLFFEIIIFLVTFCGNKDNDSETTQNFPAIIPQPETNHPINGQVNDYNQSQNPTILVFERERIIREEIPHVYVNLKFKDNKNKNKLYELKVDNKRRFNDILNELIGKYEIKKKEIKSITLDNKYLYLNGPKKIHCFETIEQLNITEDTGFINIVFEVPQNNELLNLNKLRPFSKLHFCIINLGNKKIDVDKNENLTFGNTLDSLKQNDKELKDVLFESIFYYNRGEKIKLEEKDFNKKISELNISEDILIYIRINYKDNTPINFDFIWVNENNKRYNHSAGKKETFHSVAIEFMELFDEFLDNNISQFYVLVNQDELEENDTENVNILATGNQNTFMKIIETESEPNFETLEKLKIENGSEIFFMTRKGTEIEERNNEIFRTTMRNSMIMVSQMKEKGIKFLTFKATDGTGPYVISVNENEKFEEAIFNLKKQVKKFNNLEIRTALLNGENLMREEKLTAKIIDLQIKETDIILLNVG